MNAAAAVAPVPSVTRDVAAVDPALRDKLAQLEHALARLEAEARTRPEDNRRRFDEQRHLLERERALLETTRRMAPPPPPESAPAASGTEPPAAGEKAAPSPPSPLGDLASPLAIAGNDGGLAFQPPVAVGTPRLEYPPVALRQRIEGVVDLEADIDESGRVSAARVVSGVPELNKAALRSVLAQSYRPAQRAGRPVRVSLPVRVRFRLEK